MYVKMHQSNVIQKLFFQLIIHSPYEYADTTSGGANEKFIALGKESFVRVDASSVVSTTDIARYSVEKVCEKIFFFR